MKMDNELKALLKINAIIEKYNLEEDEIDRVLTYLVEKHSPYIIWSKRDLMRNIERVLACHSETMVNE
jgi:hypothetical protein